VRKLLKKHGLGKPRKRSEYNIKVDLRIILQRLYRYMIVHVPQYHPQGNRRFGRSKKRGSDPI
jgi:hypothetical protein